MLVCNSFDLLPRPEHYISLLLLLPKTVQLKPSFSEPPNQERQSFNSNHLKKTLVGENGFRKKTVFHLSTIISRNILGGGSGESLSALSSNHFLKDILRLQVRRKLWKQTV